MVKYIYRWGDEWGVMRKNGRGGGWQDGASGQDVARPSRGGPGSITGRGRLKHKAQKAGGSVSVLWWALFLVLASLPSSTVCVLVLVCWHRETDRRH